MGLFGKKKPEPELEAPPITLVAKGGENERIDGGTLLKAKQSPGFLFAQRLLADALDRRATNILLDYTQAAATISYQIDGVWHQSAAMDRQTGDMMLAVLKAICTLNYNERRARQQGKFGAQYKKGKHTFELTSQGVPTGEKVMLKLEDLAAAKLDTLDALGMREKMQEQLKELLGLQKGFVLVSSPPGHGLSATFNAVMKLADRYTRNFIEVQDGSKPEKGIENVPITAYDRAAGETPPTILPKLIRTYPDVIALRDLVDAETVNLLCDQVNEGRFIYGGIRAKDTVDAMLRVLALKASPAKFAPTVVAVVNSRVLRTLCECKDAYAPPPQMLQKLGIPPGKVGAFYQPHVGPLPPRDEKEEPRMCRLCGGLGYRGRTAVFELLVPDDAMRAALAKTPQAEVLRQHFVRLGMRSMQEEGVVLVARGITALPELLRVLKE